jgi:ATP-binding cassette subfamily C protein
MKTNFVDSSISLKNLFARVLDFKKELVIANIIAVFAAIVSVPVPLLMPLLVDEVLLQKPDKMVSIIDAILGAPQPAYMYILCVLALTIFLRTLFFAMTFLQTKYFTIISKTITHKLRKQVLDHLELVSMEGYERFGSAKANALLIVDVETVDAFLGVSVSRLLISTLTLLGVGAVLLWIHWQLALFILFFNPFVIILTTKIARRIAKLKKAQNKAFEVFQEALSETLDLYAQVRASNQEKSFLDRIKGYSDKIRQDSISFGYKSDGASRFSFLIFLSGFEIFRAAAIFTVAYSDLTIGLMLAIFGYLWVMMTPVQEILGIQYALHNASAALERINSLFALPKEPKYPHNKNPFQGAVSVRLENACFEYEPNQPILQDITLELPKGKRVALVGASGSGKSTLAQIIVGFYPLRSGKLLFDGVSVEDIGLDIVRENVFLVLQNPQLFNGTIRSNISLNTSCDEDVIWNALRLAQLESFVSTLPNGLETIVGRNGVKLSGGQRQRLSLARMIVKNPSVVILDESTSALDMQTEALLFEGIDSFLKDKTTLIIAHRLSTIKSADYVYQLDKGTLIDVTSSKKPIYSK